MQAPCENRRDSDAQPHEALIRKKSLLETFARITTQKPVNLI